MDDVIDYIVEKKWDIVYISDAHGFHKQYGYWTLNIHPNDAFVGEKSIRVLAGRYKSYLFVDTYVTVFWGFDEDSKLIDIAVLRDFDVL